MLAAWTHPLRRLCALTHLKVFAPAFVGTSSLMWVSLVDVARADSQAAADTSGPWGLGGAYFFGLMAASAFYCVAWAIKARKEHLRESSK